MFLLAFWFLGFGFSFIVLGAAVWKIFGGMLSNLRTLLHICIEIGRCIQLVDAGIYNVMVDGFVVGNTWRSSCSFGQVLVIALSWSLIRIVIKFNYIMV